MGRMSDLDICFQEGKTGMAHFTRKAVDINDIENWMPSEPDPFVIEWEQELSQEEFADLAEYLLKDREYLAKRGGWINREGTEYRRVIRVTCPTADFHLLIDPQGYEYARYTAIIEEE